MKDKKAIIQSLEDSIKQADKAYWEDHEPILTDMEYDELVRKLQFFDPENPLISKVSSEKAVGEKVVHTKPMLSLEKVYSTEELMSWVNSRARNGEEIFLIQPKYDGISGKWENGLLVTRGDGKEGTNITSRLPIIEMETNQTNPKYLLGEILIKNSDFQTKFPSLISKSGKPFKNQRNGVAGIMGCDDVDFYEKQGLKVTLVDYALHSFEVKAKDLKEKWEEFKTNIQSLDYPMDGIVIRLKDEAYSDSLGATEHHPRGAVAYKFTNKTRMSKIIGIEITQGKENLSAVAQIEPVDFDGVTVGNVKIPMTKPVDRDLPCVILGEIGIGDLIEVERSGDVIPNVVSISKNEKDRKPFTINACPFCGGELVVLKTSVSCINPNCPEKIMRKLDFSISNMGFVGIGRTNLKKIMEATGIKDIGDFMDLTQEELESTGIGPGNSENIFNEKERCRREATPEKVLACLNMPSLGNVMARDLLKKFSIEKILEGFDMEELAGIHGVGEVTAWDLAFHLKENSARNKEIVSKFKFEGKKESTGENGTICFTGKSSRPRGEMEDEARKKGYTPVSSVTKELSILVCADPSSNSGKMGKAKKLGVKVISEEEFWKL